MNISTVSLTHGMVIRTGQIEGTFEGWQHGLSPVYGYSGTMAKIRQGSKVLLVPMPVGTEIRLLETMGMPL